MPDLDPNNTTNTAPSSSSSNNTAAAAHDAFLADPSSSTASYESTRPPFTPATMATNFTRFNARIGVVFKFQSRAIKLLSWRRPSHTLSFLAVYTLVCLDPHLLVVLPPAIALLTIFLPAFLSRHPPSDPHAKTNPPRPQRSMSSHFLKNMGDLQNSMEDYSRAHDHIVTRLVPLTDFSDEALSSALFIALFALTLVMTIAAHLLPWRAVALCGGWAAVVGGHPAVAKMLQETQAAYFPQDGGIVAAAKKKTGKAAAAIQQREDGTVLDDWIARDIILDSAPETREVEIFELQHLDAATAEWVPWLFSPSPYDPLSQARITGDRPRGTRFFEDVQAPEGWEWSEKKWALDLWSREWVEERIITGVEVETEGERWVYDMFNENDAASGIRESLDATGSVVNKRSHVSWEEGEEGDGRRGEWRRRRWVRLVKRKTAKRSP